MKKILIIGGTKQIGNTGYRFERIDTVKNLPNKVRADLALVDGEFSDKELAALWERLCNIPVIMMFNSENLREEPRAEDFLVEPFTAEELDLRIAIQLRRSREIVIGDLRINNETHECTVSGKSAGLTPLEFRILWFLCERRGSVVAGKELYEEVWGEEYLDSSDTIMPHIARIRRKLGEPARKPRYLKTIWGVGYKIADSV